ncbi:hypothetical protein [Saccharopolyspora hordei]|uniref:PE domain-containing protein n=1 Tax=Saccharopolyspora hordei TaxID=1838 RepID=A0A853AQ40_9PSEU|nr:hypothetical protein [Saccharopolyspora hordei]NYI82790.1 hypothetical protein [Saccharopolyspora hordei]
MPLTAPWGDSSTEALPGVSGGSVQVEPAAIPKLVNALQESLDAVGLQIEHAITELRIRPWAGDPVSAEAAEEFNRRSVGGGEDALTALCGYRDQLQAAAESLERANREYERIDQDSAMGIGGC